MKKSCLMLLVSMFCIILLFACSKNDNNILDDSKHVEEVAVDTSKEYELLQDIVKQIRVKIDFIPEVAIVLGSGLNSISEKIDKVIEISYKDIKGLPVSTAPGHIGKFVFGYIENVPVVIMQGRVHCYEGYSSLQVVRPIRVMNMLGAKFLVLTNSSGGVNMDFKGGEIMMITNQILYGVQNPLIGANIDKLGDRFPDTKELYDKELQKLLRESAKKANVDLKEGVYLQDTGPTYETSAETKMFRTFGADAVGMSTGIEAIAGLQMGMKVCGLSCVTTPPADISNISLNEDIVNTQADMMTKELSEILMIFISELKG